MNNLSKHWKWIFIFLIFLIALHIQLISSSKSAPETILINVFTPDGLPAENAICNADIYKNSELFIENKSLTKIESLSNYVDVNKLVINQEKGYYKLETGLKDYKGQFKIMVGCYLPDYDSYGITEMNNTKIPCELREGKFLIC